MGKPMIAISLNYRHLGEDLFTLESAHTKANFTLLLGFGFLSGGDIPPENWNAGLKYQRIALRWIQENIQAFGGDPKHVVIAGESAGAWSVGYQLIAHGGDGQGLFHGAILQVLY